MKIACVYFFIKVCHYKKTCWANFRCFHSIFRDLFVVNDPLKSVFRCSFWCFCFCLNLPMFYRVTCCSITVSTVFSSSEIALHSSPNHSYRRLHFTSPMVLSAASLMADFNVLYQSYRFVMLPQDSARLMWRHLVASIAVRWTMAIAGTNNCWWRNVLGTV